MINFPALIPDFHSHCPAIFDSFLSYDAIICYAMTFPPLGNSDHVVVSVSIDFPSNSNRDVSYHHIAYDYSLADWDSCFCLYKQNESSESKVKSRQTGNR